MAVPCSATNAFHAGSPLTAYKWRNPARLCGRDRTAVGGKELHQTKLSKKKKVLVRMCALHQRKETSNSFIWNGSADQLTPNVHTWFPRERDLKLSYRGIFRSHSVFCIIFTSANGQIHTPVRTIYHIQQPTNQNQRLDSTTNQKQRIDLASNWKNDRPRLSTNHNPTQDSTTNEQPGVRSARQSEPAARSSREL